jgi:carboxyl-terminal processing protease
LKKIEVNPLILGAAAIILLTGSFYAGDAVGGNFNLPFLSSVNRADFSGLNSLYGLLQRNFDGKVTSQKALDGAKAGLVASAGDPYTVYLDATSSKALSDELTGKLSGIGAEIGVKNNVLTVIAPIASAPAEKAGIKAGDLIAKINGEDTTNMSVDTAVSKIRGTAGTKVTLNIVRAGSPAAFDLSITRADITVPSVKSSLKNGNIGYITIAQFGPDTADLVDKAAGDLKSQGATKVILDLRNNPGGYLDAGVAIASQFLPEGKVVVSERTGGKTTNTLTSAANGKLIGLPTIVLINAGSASASEIVAGALHDNKVAQLLGVKSFGKGSVQEIKDLPGGAQLKVTVAHWYTPNGININKEGIKPDVSVDLTPADFNAGSDPQLDKAIELLK